MQSNTRIRHAELVSASIVKTLKQVQGDISLLFFLLALILSSCAGGSKLSNQNLSYIYNPELEELHPQFKVVSVTDSVSRLFFKADAGELLYTKKQGDDVFSANFTVSYQLIQAFEAREVLDSGSFVFEDRVEKPLAKDIISYVDFDTPRSGKFLVKAALTDLNRNQVAKAFVDVDHSTSNSRNNFYLKKNGAEYPLFNQFLDKDEYALYHKNKNVNKFMVRYYRINYPLAPPPFAIVNPKPFEYAADSLFTVQVGETLKLRSEGIYHFQVDSSNYEGFTLFKFANNFPNVSNAKAMLEPLRYITTKQEYTDIENSANLKAGIEAFWLDASETNDRGRELIQKYYSRVEESNKLFTSYMQGWKTDRGLIYMIFGPPNVLYKTSETETWVYGEENNVMSLNFSFSRLQNPFSENDYVLNRSTIYKSTWFRAVDSWRKGRVYTDN
ncbi:MAG: GWxTD domain-containing protein [Bacteroidia bacterium]